MTGVDVGDPAPDFAATDIQGKLKNLGSVMNGQKTLLVFYRGGWCPYCNEQLASISRDYQKFKDQGVAIVAVSAEEVEEGKDLLKKLVLPFTVLSDTKFEGIDRYGVRDSNPSEKTRARGVTQLAKPAAFIIDETGIVRYKYIGKNAPDRPKNEDLLRVLTDLDGSGSDTGQDEVADACSLY